MLTTRSLGPSAFFLTLSVTLSTLGAAGCSDRADGPTEPSNTIATVAPSPSLTSEPFMAVVSCEGDAADIVKLGSLCDATPMNTHMGLAQAESLQMVTRASTDQELLIYAFPPSGVSAETSVWVPSEVRYAAFLVLSGPTSSSTDAAWLRGDALSGTLSASVIGYVGCSEAWIGSGVLHWRSVTMTLAWSAGIPC